MPSTISYLSSVYPDRAGAVGSVLLFLCFVAAAISVSISVTISDAIGTGWFFVIIAAVNAVCQLWASVTNSLRVGKYIPTISSDKETITEVEEQISHELQNGSEKNETEIKYENGNVENGNANEVIGGDEQREALEIE